jgi:hypothetical protein
MITYNRLVSCLIGSLALLASASAAFAVTVTNRDDKDHKLTVIEGEAKKDLSLKAAGVLENLCPKGCVIRLNDSESDEYELEGTEVVSIEDGYLYYDGPDAPAEPAPGTAPKPQ